MHSAGTDEEYIQKAIAEEVKILGFSDHCPTVYPEPFKSYYKMTPEEAPEYMASLRALREKYRDKIEIHIGFEAEFLPDTWDASFELWRKLAPEYLILGQHYIDFEIKNKTFGDHTNSSRKFGDIDYASRDRLRRYVDGVVGGMASGVFSCLAHPDLVTFTGDADIYREEMKRVIEASIKYGVPLEYNLLGLREKRSYPEPLFWTLAAEYGVPAVIGCDAHYPEDLADPDNVAEAKKNLKALGIKILNTIELRRPFGG